MPRPLGRGDSLLEGKVSVNMYGEHVDTLGMVHESIDIDRSLQ